MKIWSGSAASEGKNSAYDAMLDKDLPVDKLLIRYEALSLMAYNRAIYDEGILNKNNISSVLNELLEIYYNGIDLDKEFEDVHGNVEHYILNKLPDAGKNLRMFLSRNEEVHTDVNLFINDLLIEYESILYRTMLGIKENKYEGVLPGYTHFRQAMPISFGTYKDYIENIIVNAFNKINNLYAGMKELPLGYGSGFGSLSDVNFEKAAKYLDLKKDIKNPLYSAHLYIDMYIDTLSIITEFLISMSRVFQDLIIFSGDEMGIIELPSGYVTGSSLMSNKVNPDYLEIFQGYASKSISLMNLVYSISINKTPGYHRDFQMIKDEVIPFIYELTDVLNGLPDLFSKMKFNAEKSLKLIKNSTYATYNSKIYFGKSGDWKSSYKEAGNRIKNKDKLEEYTPETIITFNGFDNIGKIIDNNMNAAKESRGIFLMEIKKIVDNLK